MLRFHARRVRLRQRTVTPSMRWSFPPFGAEALDHRVARDRVGQSRAHGGVGLVGRLVGGGHVEQRRGGADDEEQQDGHAEVESQPRVAQRHGHREAGQQQQGGPKVDRDHVPVGFIGPHAAAELADRRPGEVIGVPVGAESLDATKPIIDEASHDVGGKGDV